MHLSVIIPAYNEERRLPGTLKEIDKYLRKQNYQSEIIVVDGGSKDRTPEVIKEMSREIGNLKLLSVQNCSGEGQAVKEGMALAGGDFKVFTDADNSTSIDQVEKMWPWFEKGYDVVIGSRDIKGAVLDPPQPWIRNFLLGGGFKLYRKLVIGLWGIEDTQCGFKGFTKKAAENIFPKTKIEKFSFDPEVLVIAKKLGYKIKEIPVYWKNDPESKVKLKSIFEMALDLIKIKWNLIIGKYKWQSR